MSLCLEKELPILVSDTTVAVVIGQTQFKRA